MTYLWEQYDLGSAVALCTQREDSPLFRSFAPSRDGHTRFFPDLATVTQGLTDCEELLPNQARELNFRMTVRDNQSVGGGTVWEQVTFDVSSEGPFQVTSQNSLATVYSVGEFVQVTWDVAGTNEAPVNTQEVNILLSMDNGVTFPFVLLENTPNDGSEGVSLPMVTGDKARIKVEPSDNVYYSLSPSPFTIVEPTEPGFTFVPSQTTSFLCLPQDASIDLFTSSLLGYTDPLEIRIASQLPNGVAASLETTSLTPGESTTLNVDFSAFNQTDSVYIVVEAIGPNVDTARRELLFDVVSNDFSDLDLVYPSNGEESVVGAATFEYEPSTRARQHLLQVSTDPTFNRGSFEIEDPDPAGVQLSANLEPNTVYFWRVLPSNRCGIDYSVPINAFHTFAVDCIEFSEDEGLLIPPNIRTTVEAVVPVTATGVVTDVNVPLIDLSYTPIRNTAIYVTSPSGTRVRMISGACSISRLITGFDDEAVSDFSCSPIPNDGQARRPREALAGFIGEPIEGDWKLEVEVRTPSSSGGEFREFEIQFCADLVSAPPSLDAETVTVPTGGFQYLNSAFINATDTDNSADDLTFVIVTLPEHGTLRRNSRVLQVGDRFTMADGYGDRITYTDERGEVGTDEMTVVLSDGAGNLIATPTIDFEIGDDFATSTEETVAGELAMSLSPNPTDNFATVRLGVPSGGGQLSLVDARGRVVTTRTVNRGETLISLDVSAAPRGLYHVSYRGLEGSRTLRLAVQ